MYQVKVIAEIGINHNGDLKTLEALVHVAKKAGCDYVKTQLYDPEALFPDGKVMARGENWYDKVKKTKICKEAFGEFIDMCRRHDIEPLVSCFDLERLQWAEEAGIKVHKVASRMNRNKEFVEAVIDTGKPILMSCQNRSNTYSPVVLPSNHINYLYCIPEYPPRYPNFYRIQFPHAYLGYSDHTRGYWHSLLAVARGAKVIEKHITWDENDDRGPDHYISIEPYDLYKMVSYIRLIEEAVYEGSGSNTKGGYLRGHGIDIGLEKHTSGHDG